MTVHVRGVMLGVQWLGACAREGRQRAMAMAMRAMLRRVQRVRASAVELACRARLLGLQL